MGKEENVRRIRGDGDGDGKGNKKGRLGEGREYIMKGKRGW